MCVAPNGETLYFSRQKEGHEGIKETVVEDYQGILIYGKLFRDESGSTFTQILR